MKLSELINQLQIISIKTKEDPEVVMADYEPIVNTIYCKKNNNKSKVFITDRN